MKEYTYHLLLYGAGFFAFLIAFGIVNYLLHRIDRQSRSKGK